MESCLAAILAADLSLAAAGSPRTATSRPGEPSVEVVPMVWLQINIPLVVGCLLMAALLDLRFFKSCALAASVLLMFLAAAVMVFGTKLEVIPANAVAVLSISVWLACVVSAIGRWFRSKNSFKPFGRKAGSTVMCETALPAGAWMFDAATGRLVGQMARELQSDRLISPRSDWTIYGVVLGEAGLAGPVQLVELDISSRVNQGPEPLLVRKLSSI